MPISFFKTVKSTLDQWLLDYCRGAGVTKDQALATAKKYLPMTQKEYFTKGGAPNYQDPLCRMAYLYTYVAANANLIDTSFSKFDFLAGLVEDRLESGKPLEVCSLGGGPGSELLGIAKYAERTAQGRCLELDFTLLDRVKEWDETWSALRRDVESQMAQAYGRNRSSWPLRFGHSFLPLNLTNVESFQNFPSKFAEVHVFILNFVVSEVIDQPGDISDVVRLLAEQSSTRSVFLVIDRKQTRVVQAVQSMLRKAGLCELDRFDRKRPMDYDEEKTDLGDWLDEFVRLPKLNLNAFSILAASEQHPYVRIEFS